MPFSIYWPDSHKSPNFTSEFIQAAIEHGKTCNVAFEIHRGEMVCYRNGEYTEAYKEWQQDQLSRLEKVSRE